MKMNFTAIMPTTIKTILLATLFVLSLTSCKKFGIDPDLPAKTQDGRNTLGFMTNGRVWINGGEICNWFTCEENVVTGRLHTDRDNSHGLIIEAQSNDKRKNSYQTFTIHVKNINGAGTYFIDKEKEGSMNLITDWSKNIFYILGKDSNAKLVITRLDTLNHIISGEFSGKLYNYNDSTSSIDISDGRFDTKLTYSRF